MATAVQCSAAEFFLNFQNLSNGIIDPNKPPGYAFFILFIILFLIFTFSVSRARSMYR